MKRTEQPPDQPTPAPGHPVIDEPTTVEDCARDYQQRSNTTAGHFTAAPHTYGRR